MSRSQPTVDARFADQSSAVVEQLVGARREMLESYVKRLEDLEKISKSFKGVEKAFAIQAGRELRVMVEPERINDVETPGLAREISKKIQ